MILAARNLKLNIVFIHVQRHMSMELELLLAKKIAGFYVFYFRNISNIETNRVYASVFITFVFYSVFSS